MKRLSDLRNRVVFASVFAGLLFTATSFTISSGEDALLVGDSPQNKVQRVKVIINKDGKETKIDTTFNLPDEKMVQEKVDSVLRKYNVEGVGPGSRDIFIHHGGKPIKCTMTSNEKSPGEHHFEIFVQEGDSGRMKDIQKVIRLRESKNGMINEEMEGNDLIPPPPPPMPPHGSVIFHNRMNGDPYAFDTKDESVVSYEKKDIGEGLEKITIIRKKHDEHPLKKGLKVKAMKSTETKEAKETKEIKK